MMTEAYGLSCRPCTLLPESKLSQKLQAHHGLVPKLSHYDGKNIASLKNIIPCFPENSLCGWMGKT